MAASEGARRLSLVAGWIGAILAGCFGLFVFLSGPAMLRTEVMILVLLCVAAFLIPWGIVRVLSWVVQGFILDRAGPNRKEEPTVVSAEPPSIGAESSQLDKTTDPSIHPETRLSLPALEDLEDWALWGVVLSVWCGGVLLIVRLSDDDMLWWNWFERRGWTTVASIPLLSYDEMLWSCGAVAAGCGAVWLLLRAREKRAMKWQKYVPKAVGSQLGAIGALKWLKYVPTAVNLADKVVKGHGKGEEKKKVAIEAFNKLIQELPEGAIRPDPEQLDQEIEAVVEALKRERKQEEEARKKLAELDIAFNSESFVERVLEGDRVAVELFLTAGMNPDTDAVLFTAASMGNEGIVRALVGAGAHEGDPASGATALMLAIVNEHRSVAEFLLERGADADFRNSLGETALSRAAGVGRVDLMKLLLDAGAYIPTTGPGALSEAARMARLEVAEFLLSKGVGIDSAGTLNYNRGQWETPYWTPLMHAAAAGASKMVQFLVEKGADVNAQTPSGWTALHAVFIDCIGGDQSVVGLLLRYGANPNVRYEPTPAQKITAEQRECFWNSNRTGRSPMTTREMLIQSDADAVVGIFSGPDDHLRDAGSTPLLLAASRGWAEALGELLKSGAVPNVEDAHGRTALMWATYAQDREEREKAGANYAECERLLREAGAVE